MKLTRISLIAALSLGFAPLVSAASTQELVDLCVAAMVDEGMVEEDGARAKLKKIRGGGLKRLTLEMVSQDTNDSFIVECKVRGKSVEELTVK